MSTRTNPYEHLRIDAREQLPSPWYNYPVLAKFETENIYRDGWRYIDIHLGQQDGYWVAGLNYTGDGGGGGFHPGRKWGQFTSRNNARLWALGNLHAQVEASDFRKAVDRAIFNVSQLTLFSQ